MATPVCGRQNAGEGLMGQMTELYGRFSRAFEALMRDSARMDLICALLATLLLLMLFRLVRAGERFLRAWLASKADKIHKPVAFKNFTFIKAHTIGRLTGNAVTFSVFLVYIAIVYAYASVLFSFFEATRGIAQMLVGLLGGILSSLWSAFVAYLPKLLSIIVICVSGYYFLRGLKVFFTAIDEGKLTFENFYREWAEPTYNILRFFIFLFLLVLVFPLLPGFDSPAFKGVSVFLGVLLSLGSSSAVANAIAGVVLIYTRAFRIGDRIETHGVLGDVVDKSLLVTRIKTIKNVEVTLPNAMVLGAATQNFSKEAAQAGLILNTTVTIGYDVPWRQVHELLISAAHNTQGVLQEPEPFILQKSLDDFFVSYELNAYTREPHRMAVIYSDLHQNIQDSFNEAGVEILSPHYRALRDGNVPQR